MEHMGKKIIEDFDSDEDIPDDYAEMYDTAKKDLLLENKRQRVTTMSFHDWFSKEYKREYKQSDKYIAAAYHAGAADEIENNAYLAEHTELKMNHYKNKSIKLVDQVQILYGLLSTVLKKGNLPEPLQKLIRKVLSEQP